MADIPKCYLIFLQKACDIDKNGKLENNAQKDGQTYDEVSIFNKACESYNEKENTVIINGVVKRIQELVYEGIEEFKRKFDSVEKQDAISTYPRQQAEQDAKLAETAYERKSAKKDLSQPSAFENDLSKLSWAKKKLKSECESKKVLSNIAKYEPFFEEASKKYNVPKNVLKAICMKESTMGAGKGFWNIMQIEERTASQYKYKNLGKNPRNCIMAAAAHLQDLLKASDGNIAKALYGYNHGTDNSGFKNWKHVEPKSYENYVLSLSLAFDEFDNNVA